MPMQRRNHSVNTLTIGEFVAIHMMAMVAKDISTTYVAGAVPPPTDESCARRAVKLADALLAEFERKEQSK